MADKLMDGAFITVFVVIIVYMIAHLFIDNRRDKPWPKALDEPEHNEEEYDHE